MFAALSASYEFPCADLTRISRFSLCAACNHYQLPLIVAAYLTERDTDEFHAKIML
jgi:hypothetical protein